MGYFWHISIVSGHARDAPKFFDEAHMRDSGKLCIIHANCQGDPLAELLAASPEFSGSWRIRQYTNYTREEIPAAELAEAELFLYQYLGPEWEDVASDALLARLNSKARALCVPNMFFQGYWPFWTNKSPMAEFGDALLDKLIDSGARKPEILRVYLYGPVERMLDPAEALAETLRIERWKEERCAVRTADVVERHWRYEPLFHTGNHPGKRLLLHVADSLLDLLGLPPVPQTFRQSYSPEYANFDLPIHPRVGTFFQLPFATEDSLYAVFGRTMNCARYTSRYIDCRLNKVEETFLGYLQLV